MKDIENIKKIVITTLLDYKPVYIGLFGSFSRGEQQENSDIDLLVKFEHALPLLKLINIENKLSDKLGFKVDLVTEGALTNERIKRAIKKDIQLLYQA